MFKTKRYYVKSDIVPFEEDNEHEFKGHCNLCIEDVHQNANIPGTDKKTRQPISKVLNAFLNSGVGGTTYIGILDSGKVSGLPLTQYKKDHFNTALEDLFFKRYNPTVEKHRFKVSFIPVVDGDLTADAIERIVTYDTRQGSVLKERKRNHLIRTSNYCWCDNECKSKIHSGIMPLDYVIEVKIKAWNPDHPENKNSVGMMKAHPIHEDETGRTYFRRHGSVVQYNVQEQCNFSQQLVEEKYKPMVEKLQKELDALWTS